MLQVFEFTTREGRGDLGGNDADNNSPAGCAGAARSERDLIVKLVACCFW
jgi:hypothetical protein